MESASVFGSHQLSTVLWANMRVAGVVSSDERDKPAMYRYLAKLDAVGKRISNRISLSSICDTTDVEINFGYAVLPSGFASTNRLMAQEAVWIAASEATGLLSALIAEIEAKGVRFGLLKNQQNVVLAELKDALGFARRAAQLGGDFNFSVVT